jgi:hypothetical protein
VRASSSLLQAFRINRPNVVGESFEGEVVIVNLDSGCYFSLLGSATTLWLQLESGTITIKSAEAILRQTYDCDGMDIAGEISTFLNKLIKEDLIVVENLESDLGSPNPEQFIDKRPFEPPILKTFTDLQDILLLDPIHDVDDVGWPVAAAPALDAKAASPGLDAK